MLIDYELKNKLKLTFRIINVKSRISHAKTTFPKGPIPSPK